MKSRICHSSYVIDFLDVDFSSDEISNILQPEIDATLEEVAKGVLPDWELEFLALYNNTENILLYRKARSYTADKYKEVVIHIPIPTKDVVEWGVKKEQLLKTGVGKSIHYADILSIDPTKYNDRTSYIIECMRIGINESFRLGITVKGKRIIIRKK